MRQRLLPLLVALVLAPALAQATTITVGPSPAISPLTPAGNYIWAYAVTLEGQSQINPGDFFTIFDFDGLVAGSQNTQPNWTPSSANTGLCPAQAPFPALCAVADDSGVPNLTWTYTGAVPLMGPGVGAPPIFLGLFGARSLSNIPTNDFWVSQDQDNQVVPPVPGEAAGGNTNVPTAVPEPGTLFLLGGGLLMAARRFRR